MEVAVEEGFATYYHQVTCALNGARLAYNLDSCTGFGLQPGEPCNIDNGDNFVMNVNYDRNRLSLGIVNVGVYFCVPYNIRHYEQYGEMSGSIVSYFPPTSLPLHLQHDIKLILIIPSLTRRDSITFLKISSFT